MLVALLMHVRSDLSDPPLPGVTQKIPLQVPATIYETSEDPGLGMSYPSV